MDQSIFGYKIVHFNVNEEQEHGIKLNEVEIE